MKYLLKIVAFCIIIFIFQNCKKNENDSNTANSETDYRAKYLGNFNFTIITESWMLGQPTKYDTSIYAGVIRKFVSADSENDLYTNDDNTEDATKKLQ